MSHGSPVGAAAMFAAAGSPWRSTMWKRSYAMATALVAVGGLLGYAAASGKLNPFARAEAAPSDKAVGARSADKDSCCTDGLDKAQLLARAEPKSRTADGPVAANGKKPNIVF